MILPFKTFEALVVRLIQQQKAEEELCSGFAKYNSDYGPYLEMPLTTHLTDIISDLYGDDTDYPTLDWWIYEGKLNKETLTNDDAVIFYNREDEPEMRQYVRTVHDLWLLMEKEATERSKLCQKC